MRLRVEVSRTRTRSSARLVTLITAGMALLLVVFDRAYLAPFRTALGQLVLALVGVCFAGAFWWLQQMSRVAAPERLLVPEPQRGAL